VRGKDCPVDDSCRFATDGKTDTEMRPSSLALASSGSTNEVSKSVIPRPEAWKVGAF
jgi:hypothetical protein